MKIYQGNLIEKSSPDLRSIHMEYRSIQCIVAYRTVVGATADQEQSRSMDGVILLLVSSNVGTYRVLHMEKTQTALVVCCYNYNSTLYRAGFSGIHRGHC